MPLPKVNPKESEKQYIEKCMKFRSKENDLTDSKTREQSLAMCFTNFRKARKQESTFKSMLQILMEKIF